MAGGKLEVDEEQAFVYDPDDEPDLESSQAVGAPKESFARFGTPEEVREYYEVPGEGQQRYWLKNSPKTCCAVASGKWQWMHPVPCENPDGCSYCRAVATTKVDDSYGLSLALTTANLLLFSEEKQWGKLTDDSIFGFIMDLHKRLEGTVLKKELSYFGGLRVPQEEVLVAIAEQRLMQYYAYTTWVRGSTYSRMPEDPCN